MNPDRWDTWASNQSKFPLPARPNVAIHTEWTSFPMLTIGSVASAIFPVLFATKPPQEPHPAIKLIPHLVQTHPLHSYYTQGVPTLFNWNFSLHHSAFQFCLPSSLKTENTGRTTDTYTHIYPLPPLWCPPDLLGKMIFVQSEHQMHSSILSSLLVTFLGFGSGYFLSKPGRQLWEDGGEWESCRRGLSYSHTMSYRVLSIAKFLQWQNKGIGPINL